MAIFFLEGWVMVHVRGVSSHRLWTSWSKAWRCVDASSVDALGLGLAVSLYIGCESTRARRGGLSSLRRWSRWRIGWRCLIAWVCSGAVAH